MNQEPTDAQLIAAHLNGDEDAFRVLVERYLKPVYNFTLRFADPADAEDIVQETFVKAWKRFRTYRGEFCFRSWLFGIARNTAIDWLRKKRPAAFSSFENAEGGNPLLDSLADAGPVPDEIAAAADDTRLISGAVSRLPADYRAVVSLRHDAGCTFEEIGRVQSKPLNTVKSQYRRAILALRRLVATDTAEAAAGAEQGEE